MLPVFPGCHVICRPATFHGLEPPPVLPSLDKRARIELALLVERNGIEPLIWLGFNHGLSFTGLTPLNGLTGRTRTCEILFPNEVTNLWPTVRYMVREVGLEPTS